MSEEWFQHTMLNIHAHPFSYNPTVDAYRDIRVISTFTNTVVDTPPELFTVYYPEVHTYRYNADGSVYNGKTVSYYNIPNIISYRYSPGLKPTLSRRVAYDNQNHPIHKEEYIYQRTTEQTYQGIRSIQEVAISGTSDDPASYNSIPFGWGYTYHHVGQIYIALPQTVSPNTDLLDTKHEILYAANDSIIKIENYSYDNSRNQLIKIEESGSGGGIFEREFVYPSNSHQLITTWNMYSAKLEDITRNNGQEIKRLRYNYPTSDTLLPQPLSIDYSSIGASSLQTEITYKYDQTNGNLLQYIGRDGVPVSYLWGYNNKYPVAKIVGIAHSVIKDTLSSNQETILAKENANTNEIESLISSLKASHSGAEITGYSYIPLVGLSAEISPNGLMTSYGYDTFGRLLLISDHNGKSMERYEYNYTGAITPPVPNEYTVFIACSPPEGGITTKVQHTTGSPRTVVTATPNNSYIFDGWYENGVKLSSDVSYTAFSTRSYWLTARFIPKPSYTVEISVSPSDGGTVSGGGSFLSGATAAVTALAKSEYVFDGWYDGQSKLSSNTNYSFTVTKNCLLEARFIAAIPYTITTTATPSNGGTITGGGNHMGGATATLTATASSNYTFAGWKESGVWIGGPISNGISFTVTNNRTLQAIFASGRPATNYLSVSYENGKQYLRAAYPVASSLVIQLRDGDGGTMVVTLNSGQTEICIAENDWYWDVRTITPSTDSYYLYSR